MWGRISQAADPLQRFLHAVEISGRGAAQSLESLRQVMRLLAGESMTHNPSEAIRLVVERGYADYARAKFPNAQARLDDLEPLSQYALRYDDVNAFLEEVALANPLAGEDVAVVGPEDEKVVLSSVHQAKGLEWRAVFVIWLADGAKGNWSLASLLCPRAIQILDWFHAIEHAANCAKQRNLSTTLRQRASEFKQRSVWWPPGLTAC